MKILTAIMVALVVAVTAGVAAQETSKTQANNAVVLPVIHQAEHWTNGVYVLAVEYADPVILLFPDSKPSITADGETKYVSIRVPESSPSIFDHFSGNEILFWTQEPVHTNRGTRAGNKVRIIVLEPEDDGAGGIRTLEYSDLVQENPAWYMWINPHLFLTKWADYWLHGTRATPVVLVLFNF